jgi:hypothetical protein
MHPADLLIKLGAVNLEKKVAYPQYVYFSKEDYTSLRKNLKQLAKKSFNGTNRAINYSVGVDLLNYGPNESLKDAIRPGYALVDEEAIEKETN